MKVALRQLLKNPGFTAVAVLTLALGIGATTTVFSIVNDVLLRPLDYPDSGRIVHVWEADREKGFQQRKTSPANFADWRRENDVFEDIAFAAHHSGWLTLGFIYAADGMAERLPGRFVSTHYFKVFGLSPLLGRTFLPEEETPGARRVIVISHHLWLRLFEGSPDVIGRTMVLENQGRHAYEIIGVMPEGFRYPGADVWVSSAHMPRSMERRGGSMLEVVARLKEGVSLGQAQTAMNVIQTRIHSEFGHLEQRGEPYVIGREIRLQPILETMVAHVRPSLLVFSGAVGLVLLIACANVANLLLSRALARRREMSVRTALGAGRWRLVWQMLQESIVLALAGGVTGMFLAWGGVKLVKYFSDGSIPRLESVGIDGRVLGFALLASLATGVLFGLAPALQFSKADLGEALKEGTNRASGGLAHQRLRGAFTIVQFALAMVLLIGAGLLAQSFHRLQNVEPGFDAEQLLTVEITMTGADYETSRQRALFVQRLTGELRGTPGVEAVSAVSMIPDRRAWAYPFAPTDRAIPPIHEQAHAGVRNVSPDFLKTYGIPLLRGREFTEADTERSENVAMVNETFAAMVYPEAEALDRQIECQGSTWRIVGVFADVKNTGLAGESNPEICVPYSQWNTHSVFLTVRTPSNPMALAPVVTEHVRAMNPRQPLNYFRTMQSYLDQSTASPRFRSMLLGSFALVALLLASVGIYGVTAYAVAQRTGELGVRMALGATKADVLSLILRHGLKLTLVGVAIGLAASLALARVLETQLFAISTTDPLTYLGVGFVLTAVALAACLVPARRATQVSPMEALRYE